MVARFLERVRLKQLFGTFAESGLMNNDRLFQFSAHFLSFYGQEMFAVLTEKEKAGRPMVIPVSG